MTIALRSNSMVWRRRHYGLLGVVATMLLASFCVPAAAQVAIGYSPHVIKPVYEGTRTIPGVGATRILITNGITFNIWYIDVINGTADGFDDASKGAARRARVDDVLTYVADVLNDTGTLDVVVDESETDGTGFLASAGTFFPCADGFAPGATLFRLDNGTKQFGSTTEEIFMTVDFGHGWFEGTGTNTGGPDLLSVLLHEITHGLGFLSLLDSDGESAFDSLCPGNADDGSPAVFGNWASDLVNGSGTALLTGSPPSLNVALSTLTSGNNVFSNGSNTVTGYNQGGSWPPVYAPGSWASGSSLGHWRTNFMVGGAVMEHAISSGEEHRTYEGADIGALVDMGHAGAAATGDPLDPDNVFVDFGGANGNGSSTTPFDNLTDAVAAANANATINIDTGASNETFTGGGVISKALTLLNNTPGSGVVTVGDAGARDARAQTGFVSKGKE